jgi:hypothetical protein
MDQCTEQQLAEARDLIEPTTRQLAKMQPKFNEGTPQRTLLERRIQAFRLSIALIERELHGGEGPVPFAREDLEEAFRAIESTLHKSVKIPQKLKEGSAQRALLLRRIAAYEIAAELLRRALRQ